MALSLSSDIIDCLFRSLPDFATLRSTILVSKSFHETFQAHPSSILASVAKTQIGPECLPCAIRLAHFDRDEYLESRTNYVQNFPAERKFSSNESASAATHPYIAALIRNDSVVTELELLFSTTYKDRKTGALSLLNPRESLRFRRGLYRWWLMINLSPPCYLQSTRITRRNVDDGGSDTADDHDEDDDDGADLDLPDVYIEKSRGLRKEFLREFSDDEVAEMCQVHNFMMFASWWARNAMPSPGMDDHILFWNGPSTTAEVFRALRSFGEPSNHMVEQLNWDLYHVDASWPGFLAYLLERNYDTSKVGTNAWDAVYDSNVILDSRVEDTEECDECHVPHPGLQMWSSSNWHLLPCIICSHNILGCLPGHLNENTQETLPLSTAWGYTPFGNRNIQETLPLSTTWGYMPSVNPNAPETLPPSTTWAYTPFVNRHIPSETPDWSEGKVLCKPCVLKLMGRHLLNFLREIKAQSGPQLVDCWYGYNCITQRKPDHAAKLNHLCDPID